MGFPVTHYLTRTVETECGCRIWLGYKTKDGYGRVCRDGEVQFLHRVMWEDRHGPIPPGMVVRHSCDTPSCINVDHLEIGTHADNANDKVVRGRSRHKIKVGDVPIIAAAKGTYREIADRFGISAASVCLIKKSKEVQVGR